MFLIIRIWTRYEWKSSHSTQRYNERGGAEGGVGCQPLHVGEIRPGDHQSGDSGEVDAEEGGVAQSPHQTFPWQKQAGQVEGQS